MSGHNSEYRVHKKTDGQTEALEIACYPWCDNDYRPKTTVTATYGPAMLYLSFRTDEPEIIASRTRMNDEIYRDSCMEFFLRPDENDPNYFNFEINANGALLLGFGRDRESRVRLEEDPSQFDIRVSRFETGGWSLAYRVPLCFLQKYIPTASFHSGNRMQGNFYKCGEDVPHPHFGSWNPIDTPAPDFHRPEFFGQLILD